MKPITIPYVDLSRDHTTIQHELVDCLVSIMMSGNFILGAFLEKFEQEFCSIHGVSYAIGVNSGLDALWLTLKALNIGNGDEVITVPNSFVATAAAITLTGAHPVFVDVDDDQNIDIYQLERYFTPKTRAIIPVHLTGRPARMYDICKIAASYGIPIIEDCAQSIGAKINGQLTGTFGIAGCFSFHPLKNLAACGDAGAIITNDENLANQLRFIRNHGLQDRNTVVKWGHNSRLDAIQAAWLSTKLKYLDETIKARRENAEFYFNHLKELPIKLPIEKPGEYCVWHAFVIQTSHRDDLKKHLAQRGIEALIHYPTPIHLQPAAKDLGYTAGMFPNCEKQAQTILSLPIRASLTQQNIKYITDQVINYFY